MHLAPPSDSPLPPYFSRVTLGSEKELGPNAQQPQRTALRLRGPGTKIKEESNSGVGKFGEMLGDTLLK